MYRSNPFADIHYISSSLLTPAQASLQEALLNLLAEKSLLDISVKELCARAYVARSTYYSYYSSMDELLCEIEDTLIYYLVNKNTNIDFQQILRSDSTYIYAKTMDFIEGNRQAFECFLLKCPNQRFLEKWRRAVQYSIWEAFFAFRENEFEDFYLEVLSSMTISCFRYLLGNQDFQNRERIYRTIDALLKTAAGLIQ